MGTELIVKDGASFTPDQLALITNTVAKGATELELQLFLHQCNRTGLDPLSNQIYCIKRRARDDKGGWTEKATIQVGIDGLRLIAERSGKYAPGEPPEYRYDNKGKLVSARVGIWKLVNDKWFQVWGEAFWNEYVQTTKEGTPTAMWKSKPHIMLGKCAESAALRRGFPAELSGIYSNEEMSQADNPTSFHQPEAIPTAAQPKTLADPEVLKLGEEMFRILTAPDCYNMPRDAAEEYMRQIPETVADYTQAVQTLTENLKIQQATPAEVEP